MSKVYNCTLGAIKEQLEDFGLDGQPVYQVALSRQSWDMGEAIFSDLNNTYKVFQRYFKSLANTSFVHNAINLSFILGVTVFSLA